MQKLIKTQGNQPEFLFPKSAHHPVESEGGSYICIPQRGSAAASRGTRKRRGIENSPGVPKISCPDSDDRSRIRREEETGEGVRKSVCVAKGDLHQGEGSQVRSAVSVQAGFF